MLRVKRELSLPEDDGIRLRMLDTWQQLEATIQGPPDSPFVGGTFVLNVKLPEAFPFAGGAPKVKFATPVWHPNVSADDGSMCEDFLSDWAAAITIRSLCIFLQSLLFQPDLAKPLNPDAARQYTNSPDVYKDTAKYWTHVHASGPVDVPDIIEKEAKVQCLVTKMQRPIAAVRFALSSADWNYDLAQEVILEPPPPPPFPMDTEEAQAACGLVTPTGQGPFENTAAVLYDSDAETDYGGYDDFDVDSDSIDESVTSGSNYGSPR